MTGPAAVTAWVARYREAWQSNDPADIAALFTDDARYFAAPFSEPWQGRDAIVEGWLAHRDEPGETEFAFELLAVCDDVAFVRGWSTYSNPPPPRAYSNLWVVRLAEDGRAREFTEWWMQDR